MSDFLAACPVNGKRCCNGIREDFTAKHPVSEEKLKCVEWIHLLGTNPQTGKDMDTFMCQRVAVPMLLVENAQKAIQTAASVDKVASEIKKQHATFLSALTDESRARLLNADPQMFQVEHKNGSSQGDQSWPGNTQQPQPPR